MSDIEDLAGTVMAIARDMCRRDDADDIPEDFFDLVDLGINRYLMGQSTAEDRAIIWASYMIGELGGRLVEMTQKCVDEWPNQDLSTAVH